MEERKGERKEGGREGWKKIRRWEGNSHSKTPTNKYKKTWQSLKYQAQYCLIQVKIIKGF